MHTVLYLELPFCHCFISPPLLWVFCQFSWFSLAVWTHFPSPFSSVLWTSLIYKRLIGYIYFGNHGIYSAQFCGSIFPLSFFASHLCVWSVLGWIPVPYSIFLLNTPWWFLVFIHFWLKFILGDLTLLSGKGHFQMMLPGCEERGSFCLRNVAFDKVAWDTRLRVMKGFSFT